MPSSARTIVIGDVHGCPRELEKLLVLTDPRGEDRVVFLGDLVNRGPDSHAVLKLARDCGGKALIGNHEVRLLNYHDTGLTKGLKEHDFKTIRQLNDEDWAYLQTMRDRLHIRKWDVVLVHGGFHPYQAWQSQPRSLITEIQTLGPDNRPQKRAQDPNAPSWADFWTGPPYVIYGHTSRSEVYEKPFSLGIDTACSMGGKLTACILPEREIIQVPAAKTYYRR